MRDLKALAMFVQVVRAGSFSQAARRLRIHANSLRRCIDQLEAQLGTRLHCSTRRISGVSVRRHFAISAALKNSLARSAGEDSDQVTNAFVAASTASFAPARLPAATRTYRIVGPINVEQLITSSGAQSPQTK